MVKHLVKNKADVNLRDKDNITAIMPEASAGRAWWRFLANNKADVIHLQLRRFSLGGTLQAKGHSDVVKLLIAEAEREQPSRRQHPGHCGGLCERGYSDIVKQLHEQAQMPTCVIKTVSLLW